MKNKFRKAVVGICAGVMFQFGGCGPIIQDLALSAAWEFIWDNDATLDFFGDDAPGLLS